MCGATHEFGIDESTGVAERARACPGELSAARPRAITQRHPSGVGRERVKGSGAIIKMRKRLTHRATPPFGRGSRAASEARLPLGSRLVLRLQPRVVHAASQERKRAYSQPSARQRRPTCHPPVFLGYPLPLPLLLPDPPLPAPPRERRASLQRPAPVARTSPPAPSAPLSLREAAPAPPSSARTPVRSQTRRSGGTTRPAVHITSQDKCSACMTICVRVRWQSRRTFTKSIPSPLTGCGGGPAVCAGAGGGGGGGGACACAMGTVAGGAGAGAGGSFSRVLRTGAGGGGAASGRCGGGRSSVRRGWGSCLGGGGGCACAYRRSSLGVVGDRSGRALLGGGGYGCWPGGGAGGYGVL